MTETPDLRDRIKELRTVRIDRIRGFAAGNPVARTEHDDEVLDASLEVNGYAMPVEARELDDDPDADVELIDGHGRISRIRARYPNVTEIKVLILDCESVAEGRAIMLGLRNQADWSMDALDRWVADALEKRELDADQVMRLSGLTAAHLDSLASAGQDILDQLANTATETQNDSSSGDRPGPTPSLIVEVDIDDELPRKPISRPGDVWTLGSSRLVCGDSTSKKVIETALGGAKVDLLWTDPPWNVALDAANKPTGRSSTRKERTTIKNDALGKGFAPFVEAFAKAWAGVCSPGTPIYVAMSSDEWGTMHDILKAVGFHWSSTIIWSKNSLILSRKDFHPQYEPLWYGWREGAPRRCSPVDRAVSDVWPLDRPRKSDLHPSMKPVALVARSINYSSKPGDLVLDTFGGSGTTILAAEQLGRRAALVELDPAYCDVIVDRWQRLTGRKATRTGG